MPASNPTTDALVRDMIKRIADKWTWLVLELLAEREHRFSEIRAAIDGISQKVLTHTLRQLERDGLVARRVTPTIPPRVDYRLTPLGASLAEAFCSVWLWAEKNHPKVARARTRFDQAAPRAVRVA